LKWKEVVITSMVYLRIGKQVSNVKACYSSCGLSTVNMWFLFLVIVCPVASQEPHYRYNLSTTEWNGPGLGVCPSTEKLRENIKDDVNLFLNSRVVPILTGRCSCGGPGWRRAAYLNMSDPTQTCPPAWELITTPRRSCARPSNTGSQSCYSAMFPIQYS
jgi:hypothetical protein